MQRIDSIRSNIILSRDAIHPALQAEGYAMFEDECLWPEKVGVGEVVYPPGGTFGPRLQRNLQLIMIHTGHMTVWIDGTLYTAPTNTVSVLFPGHQEYFAFAEECETRHSWLHVFLPQFPEAFLARLARLPWHLPLSPAMTDLIHEALALKDSPLSTAATLRKALAVQIIWRYIGEGELLMTGATTPVDPAVENARRFILAHLGEPLTLDMIARAAVKHDSHGLSMGTARSDEYRTAEANRTWSGGDCYTLWVSDQLPFFAAGAASGRHYPSRSATAGMQIEQLTSFVHVHHVAFGITPKNSATVAHKPPPIASVRGAPMD